MSDPAESAGVFQRRTLVNPPEGEEDRPVEGFQVVSQDI